MEVKMLTQQVRHPRYDKTFPERAEQQPGNWKMAARAAYYLAEHETLTGLRGMLASRLLALTGYLISPSSIVVDRESQQATGTLDGMRFQLKRHQLRLVRHCVSCGLREHTSPPLETLADLGHALAVWEPRCDHCIEGDVEDATSVL
jgi:hypothetical protein